MPKNKAMAEMPEMKPMLHLTQKDLEEVAAWEVGDEYRLLLVVKQVSKSIEEYNGKKIINARFEIVKIKDVSGNAATKNFEDFEKSYSKK